VSFPIVIMYFISDVVFMFAIKRFMGVFFERRRTSFPVMAVSYLLYLGVTTVVNMVYDTLPESMGFIFHVMSILPVLFIISLNYESSIPKRFVATGSNYALFITTIFLAGSFVYEPLVFLLNDGSNDFVEAGGYMAASLLFYLLVYLFKRFKNIRKRNLPMPLFWISSLVVLGATICPFIFFALNLPLIPEISFSILVFGANILVFYIYDILSTAYEDKLKSVLRSQEGEYYISQCRLMQESLEKMKSYRHDMKTHLTTIKKYTADNKKAAEYLDNLLGGIEEGDVYSNTGNIAFDSIINFKLKNVKEDNIKPKIEIAVPLALNIEVADVVNIIGSLLDNALEAVAKVEEKIIRLNINFSEGDIFIKMENAFDGEANGDQRSCGLENIRNSVEKYNGTMDIAYRDHVFSVGLLLHVGYAQIRRPNVKVI